MSVSIQTTDGRLAVDRRGLSALIRKVLSGESASGSKVNIVYCSDSYMKELNARFKGKDATTDVLSFSLENSGEPEFLGEVYINLRQARRQAADNKVSYEEEVKRLTIHGVLHLLGYLDNTESNRSDMWIRQESYLK